MRRGANLSQAQRLQTPNRGNMQFMSMYFTDLFLITLLIHHARCMIQRLRRANVMIQRNRLHWMTSSAAEQ